MHLIASAAILVAGLVLLEAAADRFTDSVGDLARHLRASEGAVALLTAGGEWEELAVVLLAMAQGHPGLALGNIVGACIANLLGSLPLGLLGPSPLVPDRSSRVYAGVMLGVTLLAAGLMTRGRVGRPAAVLLLAVFAGYAASVLLVVRHGWLRPPEGDDDDEGEPGNARSLIVSLAGSLFLTCVAAEMLVFAATGIAHGFGLPEYAIGATVVAIGATLPDKAISLLAGLRGQGGLVASGATGSNIFLLSLVLGLSALASPNGLAVPAPVARLDVPLLAAASAGVALLLQRKSLHRGTGVALLSLYVAYVAWVLARGWP